MTPDDEDSIPRPLLWVMGAAVIVCALFVIAMAIEVALYRSPPSAPPAATTKGPSR